MAGASLYLLLFVACFAGVAALFGAGWLLVVIGRRQEARRRAAVEDPGAGG